jgi:alkanesulfonate monooxygenase SsuD/methylene tetrahydromethanopterin reductase-like flavin-dependent oxidoreductase (luciferase family)
MSGTTRPIRFGFCVPIFACPGANLFRTPSYPNLDAATTMGLARVADELGYDSLWVADHLMLGKDDAILEGWTVLAALTGATHNAKLGMIHQALLFRNPALAAKMAATLDQISGGRLIHFMDFGYMGREYVAYGLPWDDNLDVRTARLAEAIELILALWTNDVPISRDGPTYRLRDAVCNPKPLQQPHPPLWFGEASPGILDICARYGQGWNTTPVSVAELRRRLDALMQACERIGRPVGEIEKSLEMQVLVAPDRDALRARLGEMVALAPRGGSMPGEIEPFLARYGADPELLAFIDGDREAIPAAMADDWIIGTPDEVTRRLREYVEVGIEHFLLWFMDAPHEDGLRLFMSDVVPRFRA